ncbi:MULTISPECIES: response regulator transcription factor [Anaerococcus]|uniref:Response regulator receiver domain protein n=3 Tax=Anaerococcus TaxID=165779 RepID=C7HUX7_9FIRM|nr:MULTISPECIES: response regulator transcription factor [Anaerococcus]EEU12426.1 response regulator receiver domain protein [Anaerococcus vaginalis ATCC 51170]MDU0946647.1 response regulator transcription factor [Anaerococcus vaginalis]MDU1030570.1 response regulator transcription factor [Anaerococcus vaginalis]MDU2375043.1 response regulator transcription factor [Anaerococcus vaginalis]MDU5251597.1 response regulator transcription factor [Anaerococcus vaginalis]
MNDINILIIEDEQGISKIIKSYLEKEGYNVFQAFDGKEGLDFFENEQIDLILLDLMIPKISGEDLIKEIRNKSNVPVIMVTAKVSEENIINGLKLGADDYVTKPFSPKELMQRIKTVLRRIEKYNIPRADIIKTTDGRLEMDLEYNRFFKDGEEIFLTKNEFQIIKTLFSNPNKIFTREEIIEITFGFDYDAYDRAIDTHIKNIRQKIEDNPKKPDYIKTIYGMGYKSGGVDDVSSK